MARTWNWKTNPIQRKVQSARVRHLAGLVLEQTAIVMAIALPLWIAFSIGPVITHRELWMAFAVGSMAAAAVYQVKRRFRTSYEVAQILDSRAGQRDLFSTAWFLLENPALAAGPNVSAQIARANMALPQIPLSDLFPVPLRSALAVAGLSALLIASIFVLRGQVGKGKSLTAAPGFGSRPSSLLAGPSSRHPDTGERERGGTDGALAKNAPGVGVLDPPLARGGQASSGVPSPSMDAGARQTSGKTGREDELNGVAPDTTGQAFAGAAKAGNGPMGQPEKQSDEGGGFSKKAEARQESLASRWLAPIRRLLDNGKQPLTTAKVDKQPETATNGPAAAKRDLGHSAGAVPAPSPGGQQVSENGSGVSAQQPFDKAPANSAENRGGASEYHASVAAAESFPVATNVIELAQTNPDGETGHSKVEAVRAAPGPKQAGSSDRTHLTDSGYGSMRDDVPLGYQHSVQAYFQRDKR